MAIALAKDASDGTANVAAGNVMPENLAALDAALGAAAAKLAEATAAREQCRDRRKKFAANGDRASYLKEKRAEDELDFEVEASQAKIDAFQAARPAIAAREAAERIRIERSTLLDKSKKFQKGALKKLEEAIAVFCEFLPIEEALFREISEFNQRAQAASLDPIESPEVSRHCPGEPARQNGTREVKRSRLRQGIENSTASGADRYETYTALEPVIIPEIPEFKPAPIFRRVIVPSFHRDGPAYHPTGVTLPWYGR
jgi:hypothetical protein